MQSESDYAKSQAEKHKRKIILPSYISWEYGTNKLPSQKGQSAFGTIRNTKLKNDSDVEFWKKNDVIHYVYEEAPNTVGEGDVKQEKNGRNGQEDAPSAPSSSGPRFQSQHDPEDKDHQYKAWIGGQTATYSPSTSQHN